MCTTARNPWAYLAKQLHNHIAPSSCLLLLSEAPVSSWRTNWVTNYKNKIALLVGASTSSKAGASSNDHRAAQITQNPMQMRRTCSYFCRLAVAVQRPLHGLHFWALNLDRHSPSSVFESNFCALEKPPLDVPKAFQWYPFSLLLSYTKSFSESTAAGKARACTSSSEGGSQHRYVFLQHEPPALLQGHESIWIHDPYLRKSENKLLGISFTLQNLQDVASHTQLKPAATAVAKGGWTRGRHTMVADCGLRPLLLHCLQ